MVRAKHLPPILLLCVTGYIWPSTALAVSENAPLKLGKTSGGNAPHVSSGGLFLQMALALAITIGVIWLVYRGLKLWNKRSSGGTQQSAAVQVISRTEVDRDMTVYVLQLGDTVSVVSRTSQGSTLLREMSREEAEIDGLHSSINPVNQSLGGVIGEVRSKFSAKKKNSQPPVSVEELLGEDTLTVDDLLAQSGEDES
jgi:flagellar biogenesis protein FliO